MISFLTEDLPEVVEVYGIKIPLLTDFRRGLLFDSSINEEVVQSLIPCFVDIEKLPFDTELNPEFVEELCFQLMAYYSMKPVEEIKRRVENVEEESDASYHEPPVTDFKQDSGLIYASFLECYQIDLTEIESLHWWKFRTLLECLNEDCHYKKVMGYLAMDLKGMSKDQKKHYLKLKRIYALKDTRTDEEKMSSFAVGLGL